MNKEQAARKELDKLENKTREFGKKKKTAEQRRREIERKEPTARDDIERGKSI